MPQLFPLVVAVFLLMAGCRSTESESPDSPPFQYRLRQIMIEPTVSESRENSIRMQAEDILSRARSGEDFTTLAKTYSEEPAAAQTGGDLGFFQRNDMVKPFSDAVFAMNKGEIAGPVKTQYGYHVIKLIGIDGEKRHAQHILFMLTPGSDDSLAVLETLKGVRKKLIDGADFGDMVAKYVTVDVIRETEGYMVWQKPDEMLPSFFDAVQGLKKGGLSEPFLSILGYHVVMVDSINYNPEVPLEGFPARIARKLEHDKEN